MRDSVLMVHGVWSNGAWHKEVAWVYKPHFRECISIKYPQYRWFGPLALILEPYVVVVLVLVVVVLYKWPVAGYFKIALYGFLLIVAYLATYLRRTRAFNTVLRQASPYAQRPFQPQTHLIAHSLGTYLMGRALRDRPEFHLGRVVLVGCVIPRSFAWSELRAKCLAVRNELARKDVVVYLAWLMSWLIRGLGISGFSGFNGPPDLIHDVENPSQVCTSCPTPTVLVHNMLARALGHSGTFVGTGYAEAFWLLFFWGIEPPEYAEFIDLCNAAAGLEREWSTVSRAAGHEDPRLIEIKARLRNRIWRWCSGTFGDYVAQEVQSRFPTSGEPLQFSVGLAITGTWQLVRQGMEARLLRIDRKRQGLPDDPAVELATAWLNPKEAVRRAVALLP